LQDMGTLLLADLFEPLDCNRLLLCEKPADANAKCWFVPVDTLEVASGLCKLCSSGNWQDCLDESLDHGLLVLNRFRFKGRLGVHCRCLT
jgi:hypothetical protein